MAGRRHKNDSVAETWPVLNLGVWCLSHGLRLGRVRGTTLERRCPMTSTEIVELRRVIGQMRHCVSSLRARYGDVAAVQRLANDVERMDIDATELVDLGTTPRQREAPQVEREVVVVPDTPYDESLWKDADDEGLGGYRNRS